MKNNKNSRSRWNLAQFTPADLLQSYLRFLFLDMCFSFMLDHGSTGVRARARARVRNDSVTLKLIGDLKNIYISLFPCRKE